MALIYATFTLSTLGVAGRFTSDSLLTMQFLMVAAALTTVAIVGRNLLVRRHDIESRFRLEQAHREMHTLSQQDPLTGAWNRRFLAESFERIVREFAKDGAEVSFALLDIDEFKTTNDRYGHHHGDGVLRLLVAIISRHLGDTGVVVRLGGDEFAVLYRAADGDDTLIGALTELRSEQREAPELGPIRVSAGIVRVVPSAVDSLDAIYRRADEALYAEKLRRRRQGGQVGPPLAQLLEDSA
jgi:diguanylate cyclase (GGDEF)-like protein